MLVAFARTLLLRGCQTWISDMLGPCGPHQATTCSPPSSLVGADQYRADCKSGQQYNAATTGLLISSLVVGAAGTASFILGAHQASRGRVEVRPALSYNEASLTLRFPF